MSSPNHPPTTTEALERPPARHLGYLIGELILALVVALVLHRLALDAAFHYEALSGLGQRYGTAAFAEWSTGWPSFAPESRSAYAIWLRWAAPIWLPAWVMLGGLGMVLARSRIPSLRPLAGAMTGLLIGLFGSPFPVTFGLESDASVCMLWAGAGLFAGLVAWALIPKSGVGGLTPSTLAQAALWPGFALISGMAWLALADFAAAADPKAQFLGIEGAQGLLLATLTALLLALLRPGIARGALTLAEGLARSASRPRLRWSVLGAGLLLAVFLGLLGRAPDRVFLGIKGLGQPHLSGEVLRGLAMLAIAWVCYRSGEWSARIGWRFLIITLMLVVLGLWISKDAGPLLIIGMLGLLWLAIWPVRALIARQRRGLAALLALALLIGGVALWRTALIDLVPGFSLLAQSREADRKQPEHSRRDDMMRVQWLISAAPATGFGPGKTPWCGASAQIGEKACRKGSALREGAPLQTPEDYAPALWAAYYGLPVTLLAIGLVLVWLLSLILAASPARWPRPGHFTLRDMAAYALFWAIAIAALGMLSQTLIALGGTLRWSQLSGLPLPLMAYGKASLVVIAAWMGLAQRGVD